MIVNLNEMHCALLMKLFITASDIRYLVVLYDGTRFLLVPDLLSLHGC